MTIVETERLRLRRPNMDDLDPLHRIRHDLEMMRFLGDGHLPDEAETEEWLQGVIDGWTIDGFSVFVAERKSDRRPIGWVGVNRPHWFPAMMPTPEIGWGIKRELWGHGLATEGAQAVLHFAFDDLAIDRVIGIYNAKNKASGRVMEKIGMSLWREAPHPQFGFPLRIYEVSPPTSAGLRKQHRPG
jgi:RimJ/RimL family protein N-acetyltransferase